MKADGTLQVLGIAVLAVTIAGTGPVRARRAASAPLSAAVGQAACAEVPKRMTGAAIFKAQVLLDRLDVSPGVIDGKPSGNFGKAIAAFQRVRGLPASGRLDRATWNKLCENTGAPALIAYTVTDDDVRGPFIAEMPRDLEGMARLPALGYRSATQLLAEKFHTTEQMISGLNPGKAVDRAGTRIAVPNVSGERPAGQVARIEVDKPAASVRALGRNGETIAFYPASVGSREKPAPSGTYHVGRVVKDPTYHYDPKFRFKGVRTDRELTIAPGPNNPVGVVWIDLNKPTYGIHGTSHPEQIGNTGSHGCVRLTNWDALDLAGRVRKGTPVTFLDQTQTALSR
ncbi:MAG: murein L,D-transpeptidase [Bradyrhizobiaceae bacterium]|nr:murein L,D-transpeptidase [Bradyrhizobiaceae bacterium]